MLTDTFAQIDKKIRSAVTDSIHGITYDPVNRPGTSNLLSILAACENADVEEVAKRYVDKGHGVLKKDVSEALEGLLKGPRSDFERLRQDRGHLDAVAKEGAEKARARSQKTMEQVRTMIGLY